MPKILFSEEKSPQRSFNKKEGHIYFFHENVPRELFMHPRYVVFPSMESKIDGNHVYGVYTVTYSCITRKRPLVDWSRTFLYF